MEDIRTEFVPDETRESQIKHWEVTLANASHAVYVAQQTLESLYRQRYKYVTREIGSTATQRVIQPPEAA